MSRRLPGVAVLVLLVLGLGACSSSKDNAGTGAAQSTAGGAKGTAVAIKNFAFSPNPLQAKVGDPITVTNQDSTAHTITADDHSFDTGNLDGGASKTIQLGAAGTFKYHCNIHNYMTGTLTVS